MSAADHAALIAEAAPIWREALRRSDLWMYAIQRGTDGPVKIGVSKCPGERLATLQTANAEQLRGIAAWRIVGLVEEDQVHAEFEHARIRGEWFHPVPELLECVDALGGDFDDWDHPRGWGWG